jgi:hypothetical protein
MFGIVVPPGTGTEGEGLGALVAIIALLVTAAVLVAFAVWGFREDRRAERQALGADVETPTPLPNAA